LHTGERPFPCAHCPKAFRRRTDLIIHERVHTGECPFACPHCPKAFRGKTTLTRHQRVHSTSTQGLQRPDGPH
ncbi:ZN271 protein, partial [Thinocorus orbignyianus]|nr:ZN271 protein [Thinocorus orbignyianus]